MEFRLKVNKPEPDVIRSPDSIVISHTGNNLSDFLERKAARMDARMPHRGYHAKILSDGSFVKGMPFAYSEPYQRRHGDNSIGILLFGNYSAKAPSREVLDGLCAPIEEAMERFDISPEKIFTHGEIAGEPGYMALFDIEELRNGYRVRKMIGDEVPDVKLEDVA